MHSSAAGRSRRFALVVGVAALLLAGATACSSDSGSEDAAAESGPTTTLAYPLQAPPNRGLSCPAIGTVDGGQFLSGNGE